MCLINRKDSLMGQTLLLRNWMKAPLSKFYLKQANIEHHRWHPSSKIWHQWRPHWSQHGHSISLQLQRIINYIYPTLTYIKNITWAHSLYCGCEVFLTYTRTNDLIHYAGLVSMYPIGKLSTYSLSLKCEIV